MAIELKENQGVMFQNEKTNEKQPDFGGKVNIGGKDLHVSGWDNKEKGLNFTLSEKTGEKQFREVGKAHLAVNDKGDNEKRPDYKGEVTLNGQNIKISVWKRETKDQKPLLSVQSSPNLAQTKDVEHKAEHAAQKEVKKGMAI